ncbi:MAG: DNA-processing protein DprA [Beijerinckiaceae bacterium]|nr:DNA-processing protein DprA [Beijerinckiaceae bacterium]
MDEDGLGNEPLATLDDSERFDWLRLFRCENIGPKTFQVLLSRHGSAGAALAALPGLIESGKAGRSIRIATIEETGREMEETAKLGARFIAICEKDYPPLLRRTASAPPLIAVRGNLASLERSKIAIVGARNASAGGLAFTAQLARGIGRAGYVIVSGLARGIDAKAHQTALETGTIAVLAGGLGNIYPADHENLLEQIVERGAAISEMPFGWEARGRDFPRRNRIVAGLCRAIVVVEAARRSGSLITARFAAEQGREIFAVPGSPLDPRAEGANQLLRDGASFCTGPEDVTEAMAEQDLPHKQQELGFLEADFAAMLDEPLWDELELAGEARVPVPFADKEEVRSSGLARPLSHSAARPHPAGQGERPQSDIAARVAGLLGPAPVPVDELARLAEAPARQVRTILMELALAGQIEWHGGDLVSALPGFWPRSSGAPD